MIIYTLASDILFNYNLTILDVFFLSVNDGKHNDA
jgi:hypothetical protein